MVPLCRTFNIFQVYHYFTIYRQYFLLKYLNIFHEYLFQHSLWSGVTKDHFRQIKVPGTAPCWNKGLSLLSFIYHLFLGLPEHSHNLTSSVYLLILLSVKTSLMPLCSQTSIFIITFASSYDLQCKCLYQDVIGYLILIIFYWKIKKTDYLILKYLKTYHCASIIALWYMYMEKCTCYWRKHLHVG